MALLGTLSTITSLFIVLLCNVGSARAQARYTPTIQVGARPVRSNETVHTRLQSNHSANQETVQSRPQVFVPLESNVESKVFDKPLGSNMGLLVGTTYYDFQTNGSMPNRLVTHVDGAERSVQFVWMTATDSTRGENGRIPGFNPSRKTHTNYIFANDGEEPSLGETTWTAVETSRAGWPSIAMGDNGLGGQRGFALFTSHTPVKAYSSTGFSDEWFYTSDVSPTGADASWPRCAVDGRGFAHVVYNKRVAIPGAGQTFDTVNQVCYRRSTNDGQDWQPEVTLSGATSPFGDLPNGSGGDNYAIVARGNTVAIVWTDNSLQTVAAINTTNGDSWLPSDGRLVYRANWRDIDSTVNGGVTTQVFTDTVLTPNGHLDAVIDANGSVNVVVGVTPTYIIRNVTPNSRLGTIYQADGDISYYYRNTALLYRKVGNDSVTIFGRLNWDGWSGESMIINRRPLEGAVRWPQMGVGKNGDLFCLYGGVKVGDDVAMQIDTTPRYVATEADTLFPVRALYGHIYGSYKPADRNEWSAPVAISQDGVNCQYPSLSDSVGSVLHYMYSARSIPGDGATNWELPAERTNVYFNTVPIVEFEIPRSVAESEELTIPITIVPNPAQEFVTISLQSSTDSPIIITLVDSMGQTIGQSQNTVASGTTTVTLPLSNLANGWYLCSIEQAGQRTSRIISVLH
jgi:hypothetical protein